MEPRGLKLFPKKTAKDLYTVSDTCLWEDYVLWQQIVSELDLFEIQPTPPMDQSQASCK